MAGEKGFTLWFTGLSGAGKTTISQLLEKELRSRGSKLEILDGDIVRENLSKGLGFSKEDRDTHVERVGWVASRITRQGGAVITAAISPYAETRQQARDWVEPVGTFVEVYIKGRLYPADRTDLAQIVLGIVVAGSWTGLAARHYRQSRRRPGGRPSYSQR